MTDKELRKRYPWLPPKTARHVVRRLRATDWQQLQAIARDLCGDCPGYTDPEGPPCEYCPLRPLAIDAAILAAQARGAQRDKAYLDSLPVNDESPEG